MSLPNSVAPNLAQFYVHFDKYRATGKQTIVVQRDQRYVQPDEQNMLAYELTIPMTDLKEAGCRKSVNKQKVD